MRFLKILEKNQKNKLKKVEVQGLTYLEGLLLKK